jgi:hypothetical protein
MIGSLLYLTTSRPNILYNICLFARFQSNPREPHLTVVKTIFRYLKGIAKNGLLYKNLKHHFIRDYVQKGVIDIKFIDIEHQWADIFTKPLAIERFDFIKKNLCMH